ncbi:MAG: preprotein translocase subunit YajC [bacterium]|nr:preprotein translocase subunit YajC [bacterium]
MINFWMQPVWILAQAESAENAAPAADGSATGAPASSLIEMILANPLNLILVSGVLFILLVLRPQQKQMKEHQKRLGDLKKNDRVVTSGGIHGTVVQANSGESVVVIRIDDSSGARLTINRDAIANIVAEEKKEQS